MISEAPDLQAYCKEKLGDKFQEFRMIPKQAGYYTELQILTTEGSFVSKTISTDELSRLHYKDISDFVLKKIDEMIEELLQK